VEEFLACNHSKFGEDKKVNTYLSKHASIRQYHLQLLHRTSLTDGKSVCWLLKRLTGEWGDDALRMTGPWAAAHGIKSFMYAAIMPCMQQTKNHARPQSNRASAGVKPRSLIQVWSESWISTYVCLARTRPLIGMLFSDIQYLRENRAIAGRTWRCRCKFRYVSNFAVSR